MPLFEGRCTGRDRRTSFLRVALPPCQQDAPRSLSSPWGKLPTLPVLQKNSSLHSLLLPALCAEAGCEGSASSGKEEPQPAQGSHWPSPGTPTANDGPLTSFHGLDCPAVAPFGQSVQVHGRLLASSTE